MVLGVKRTKYGTAHVVNLKCYSQSFRNGDAMECKSIEDQLSAEMQKKPTEEIGPVVVIHDWELIAKLKYLPTDIMNQWEREFRHGVVEFYAKKKHLSWKQREYALKLIQKIEKKKV